MIVYTPGASVWTYGKSVCCDTVGLQQVCQFTDDDSKRTGDTQNRKIRGGGGEGRKMDVVVLTKIFPILPMATPVQVQQRKITDIVKCLVIKL